MSDNTSTTTTVSEPLISAAHIAGITEFDPLRNYAVVAPDSCQIFLWFGKLGLDTVRRGHIAGRHYSMPLLQGDYWDAYTRTCKDCYGLEFETESHEVYPDRWTITTNCLDCQEDGSLHSGMEWVSRAMPYRLFGQFADWFTASVLPALDGAGYKAWNGGRCGIHIHRSLDAIDELGSHAWYTQLHQSLTRFASMSEEEALKVFGRVRFYSNDWSGARNNFRKFVDALGEGRISALWQLINTGRVPRNHVAAALHRGVEDYCIQSLKKGAQSTNSHHWEIGLGSHTPTIEARYGRATLHPRRARWIIEALLRVLRGEDFTLSGLEKKYPGMRQYFDR